MAISARFVGANRGWMASCPIPRCLAQETVPGGDGQGAPLGNVMGNAWLRPVRQLRPARQVPFWQCS